MAPTASPDTTQLGERPQLAADLLAWYDRHARRLPWRAPPGGPPADPYHVWLSEIMLQQTTVVTVAPYFQRFLEAWPAIQDLAAAPQEAVMAAWAGLGYYARARNLHACARQVAGELGGRFPDRESDLLALPGVGPYTAAAIAAIAFDRRATVVDGNVERVVSRLFAVEAPLPRSKGLLKERAGELTPEARPGDYAQAMMDLGATVCLPRGPKCLLCPVSSHCLARKRGIAAELPRREPKKARPTKYAVAFFMTRPDGAIFLRRRPEKGMLGGMLEVPSTAWRKTPWNDDEVEAARSAPAAAQAATDWRALAGIVRHGFTHFEFEITVWAGAVDDHAAAALAAEDGRWVAVEDLGEQALPTAMRKVVAHGLKGLVA